jgi:hypothetical protein
MLAVSTAVARASWLTTERYQRRIAAASRTARSSASTKSLGPEPRKASSPIDSALTISGGSALSTAASRPRASSATFMSSSSYFALRSIVTVTGAEGVSSRRASTASSKRVSPLSSRKSSCIAARASQHVIRLSDMP